ncbi:DUF6745 domain-containing protein [Nonomuraea basaltis]|uniref:DUF6745 domain-containing protein n=1 Tax=Nonomuraea basaltis TaxID=2495887 RepID=UPI00110C54CE|nr:hypothetical protein [Nonomuraea basaltis]TMR94875.1 hypothetical protein EJK15_31690 [Nonomuraea basaltis]
MSKKVPRLTKLSAEHCAILSDVREKWLHVPDATGPAAREQAEAGVADAYRLAGLPEPDRIEWADSPMAATIAVARHREDNVSREIKAVGGWPEWGDLWETTWWQISEQVKTPLRTGERIGGMLKDEVYELLTTTRWKDLGLPKKAHRPSEVGMLQDGAILGQHDVARLAMQEAFRGLGLIDAPPADGLARVARSAGWWWPLRGAAVLTERPVELHLDVYGQPHHAYGPAVIYPDGFGVHVWRGSRVPEHVITGQVTGTQWLAEPRGQVRLIIAERMGYQWLLDQVPKIRMGARLWCVTDPGSSGYGVSRSWVMPEDIWLLETQDGPRRVPPDVKNAKAAAEWLRRSGKDYRPPTPSY